MLTYAFAVFAHHHTGEESSEQDIHKRDQPLFLRDLPRDDLLPCRELFDRGGMD